MNLNQLTKIKKRTGKRVGRGIGSGKGKTAGRGTKGQKARGSVALGFIGGTLPLYKKLPFKRGINRSGRGRPKREKKMIITLSRLSGFKSGSTVDLNGLIEQHIINSQTASQRRIKIVGTGEIKEPLTIKMPVTLSAKQKIEKAGGKIISE